MVLSRVARLRRQQRIRRYHRYPTDPMRMRYSISARNAAAAAIRLRRGGTYRRNDVNVPRVLRYRANRNALLRAMRNDRTRQELRYYGS